MPQGSRPGDVLAGRYRLVDLLTESGGGRFWRAYDRVLERHVALHVIHGDDPRAEPLMAAARRSATVLDPHVLRVLDADLADGVCYVVNEWGWGTSLDIVVAGNGPLGPRRAAWLVSEVASAMAVAHAAGVSHGRLVPENVLIDRSGGVRIIGLSVDAALHGLPTDAIGTDVADLAGLLYCLITALWAGPSTSLVAPAPREHGVILRPRRVRAGVPRTLDVLCDEVLISRTPAHARDHGRASLGTARAVADYLADFVGDPLGMPEALMASTPDVLPEEELIKLPPVPEMAVRAADPPLRARLPDDTPDSRQLPRVDELPTEAGIPIFGEDGDDVSWLQKRTEPVAPPPPFEEAAERPLFAPEPTGGEPVRRTRAPAARPGAGAGFWPWDDGPGAGPAEAVGTTERRGPGGGTGGATGGATRAATGAAAGDGRESQEVPGRSFLRLAGGITAAILLLVAVIIGVNLGRGRTPLGSEPAPGPTSGTPSGTGPTGPSSSATTGSRATGPLLTGLSARVLDPPPGDGVEDDADTPLAVDGLPRTAWSTSTYDQQLGAGGIKDGVGLVVDLGAQRTVTSVALTLVGSPTDVSLYLARRDVSAVDGLTPVVSSGAPGATDLALDVPAVRGRYVVVWLTRLPAVGNRFRGGVAEVAVRGS